MDYGHIAERYEHALPGKYGIASACIGGGQGIALLLEKAESGTKA